MLAQQIIKNTKELKVLTPTGYKSFSGMTKTYHEKVVEIKTLDTKVISGLKHKFLVDVGWVDAEHLESGMSLTDAHGNDAIIFSVEIKDEPQWLYDLLDVDGGNAYLTNGFISHNCEFISSQALLIDSIKLSYLKAKPHVREDMGFKFWSNDIGGRNKTYLVGVDPATGNGSDFTVIEVIEFPSLQQVAELRLNSVSIPLIYAKIKWLLKELRKPDSSRGRAEVMWSFERNGVGEALVAMIQNDDSPDGGVYLDGVELVNENMNRLGCYTTGKSKLVSLMQLKNLLEKISGGLTLYSEAVLFELQNFIAAGGSYQARAGCTDDTIMALAVVMKLLLRLSSYDEKARTVVYESIAPDSDLTSDTFDSFGEEPAPFAII